MSNVEFKELYIKDGKILPNDIDVIVGSLYLNNDQIIKIENLPGIIDGSLYLNNNKITKIENLPKKIYGNLWLNNNPCKYSKYYYNYEIPGLRRLIMVDENLEEILYK